MFGQDLAGKVSEELHDIRIELYAGEFNEL